VYHLEYVREHIVISVNSISSLILAFNKLSSDRIPQFQSFNSVLISFLYVPDSELYDGIQVILYQGVALPAKFV
jgi:hypothetical protein